jgi:transcriptional regulator with XRE-family HTH domain
MKYDIRAARLTSDIDQQAIADKIGISQSGYGKIERGEVKLGLAMSQAIAKAMNMTFIEFVEIITGETLVTKSIEGYKIIHVPVGTEVILKIC